MFKISVIIPVYNVEEYIEETIESLINQTMKEFEVILIDDGSTDGSLEKIRKYLNDNIRLISQKNSGPSVARNRGIEEAKGEYIAFMDSDDIIPNDSLEIRYNLAKNNDSEVVVCGTYKYDGKKKWPMANHFLEEGKKNIRSSQDLLNTLGPCNKLFKTSLIKESKFPSDIKYAEDQVFVMEAFLRANSIYASKNIAYYYRMRPEEAEGSLTKQIVNKSAFVIEQVSKSFMITAENIKKYCPNRYTRDDLTLKYFERLVDYDIWPPLKNAIIKGDEETQIQGFKNIGLIIDILDRNVINSSRKFRWIMVQGIMHKYLFISPKGRRAYLETLNKLYLKFNENSKNIIKVENKFLFKYLDRAAKKKSNIAIFRYLVRRKLDRIPNKISNLIKKKANIFFKIAKILPMKNNRVILASNKTEEISGNLKFINEELEKRKTYDVGLYLKNGEITLKDTIKMYFDFGRAKYIILDDYYRQLYGLKFKKNAEVIQVWHACGAFKKFGFSAIGKNDGNTREFEMRAHSHYTKVVTSSKNIIDEYAEAFNINKNKVIPIGVPRTDILLDEEYKTFIRRDLENKYPSLVDKKIIVYAPTFRGGPKERQNFKLELNPTNILRNIGEEYAIILKLHPSVKNGLNDVIIPKDLKTRILNLDSETDINDLILLSDIVITDYSSVVFEAALVDKKIIMYAYDKEEYLGERDFYYEYDSFVPGVIAKTNGEIIEIINENKFNVEKVEAFKNRFFDEVDGQATKRFVDTIFK